MKLQLFAHPAAAGHGVEGRGHALRVAIHMTEHPAQRAAQESLRRGQTHLRVG